ncbi:MAG: NgoFVII family restriction endonuclease [Bacteroidota bacterium]
MFLKNQPLDNINEYYNLLKIVGGLSNLFSESNEPYLYYRAAENIFCKAFDAVNHSRSDYSADASKDNNGIGLKTYLNKNGKTLQKIAEFNKDREDYNNLIKRPKEFIHFISNLRNIRLDQTKGAHNVDDLLYHCVTREKEKYLIYEENMDYIDLRNINSIVRKKNSITFNDKLNDYNFNLSKSTLFKRFITVNPIEIEVKIVNDPYETLKKIFDEYKLDFSKHKKNYDYVILPLFSPKSRKVEEKSGLNQWRSKDDKRKRKPDQVYIPVPMEIHNNFPNFFPEIVKKNKTHFNLHLPNGKIVKASMCQTAVNKFSELNKGKGLMSKPNKDLGQWILQEILKIPEGEKVTYEMLLDAGIDSVEVRKIDKQNYEIDFKKVNSYYDFIEQLAQK